MDGKLKRCENCGSEFRCAVQCDGADKLSCWCAAIEMSEDSRARLRARFEDCLCEDCLRKAAAS